MPLLSRMLPGVSHWKCLRGCIPHLPRAPPHPPSLLPAVSAAGPCVGQRRLLQQDSAEQTSVSQGSGGWKSEGKVPGDFASGKDALPGLQMTTPHLCALQTSALYAGTSSAVSPSCVATNPVGSGPHPW